MTQKTNNQIYDELHNHILEDRELQATLVTKKDLEELKGMINACNDNINSHTEKMQPVLEFLATMNSINKFLRWGGITFFAFVAFIWFMIKR